MSSPDVDVKVKAELSRLIAEGSDLSGLIHKGSDLSGFANKHHYTYSNNYFFKDVNRFLLSAENLLINRFGIESIYYRHFKDARKNVNSVNDDSSGTYRFKDNKNMISIQVGFLESALNDLEKGLTIDLFYERELVVFSDMLDQAYEFLDINLRYAAAVYGRIVLETAIKEYTKLKLPDSDPNVKFDQLIINLRKGGIILLPFENSLRANYGIGTAAAHNDKFEKYSDNEIKEFLTFIRDRVLTLT